MGRLFSDRTRTSRQHSWPVIGGPERGYDGPIADKLALVTTCTSQVGIGNLPSICAGSNNTEITGGTQSKSSIIIILTCLSGTSYITYHAVCGADQRFYNADGELFLQGGELFVPINVDLKGRYGCEQPSTKSLPILNHLLLDGKALFHLSFKGVSCDSLIKRQ